MSGTWSMVLVMVQSKMNGHEENQAGEDLWGVFLVSRFACVLA